MLVCPPANSSVVQDILCAKVFYWPAARGRFHQKRIQQAIIARSTDDLMLTIKDDTRVDDDDDDDALMPSDADALCMVDDMTCCCC